jgi:CHAD domain-containing protein
MAFRFKLNQPIKKDVRRLLVSQIEKARAELEGSSVQPANIHEARKCLKRIRSLLRIVRPALTKKTYDCEIERFRQIAELLSPLRDRQILLETAAKLDAASSASVSAPVAALQRLLNSSGENGTAHLNASAAISDALCRFSPALKAARKLKLAPADMTSIIGGFERTYRHGRRAVVAAYADPDDEAFHDVRKAIQHHSRHLQLLAQAWPEFTAPLIENARTLAQLLGEDHDLSVLSHFVAAQPDVMISTDSKASIIAAAHARQRALRLEARPLGQRAFAMKPKEFSRTVETLWAAAVTNTLLDGNWPSPLDQSPPSSLTLSPALAQVLSRNRPN